MSGSLHRLSRGTGIRVPCEHATDESVRAAGKGFPHLGGWETPPLPSPTALVRTVTGRCCCCCQLPQPPPAAPGEAGGGCGVSPPTDTLSPVTQGGRETLLQQPGTDPARESGRTAAAGPSRGARPRMALPLHGAGRCPCPQPFSGGCVCSPLRCSGPLCDVSSAWPQPPRLSWKLLLQSQQPWCHGHRQLCVGSVGGLCRAAALGGAAGGGTQPLCCPARGGGFRRGELPQIQNRCWQQN